MLYLLHDLSVHARALFAALAPGGAYYAVIGVHTGSPLMVKWHRENVDALNLPPLNDIEDVIAVFEGAGFEAAAARLAVRFVPAAATMVTVADGCSTGSATTTTRSCCFGSRARDLPVDVALPERMRHDTRASSTT